MKFTNLNKLIEQIIHQELEEQNAIVAGGVSATSTGGALTADKKKHLDKTGNGTRHDILWTGDDEIYDKKSVTTEQTDNSQNSTEQLLINALRLASGKGVSAITLDQLVASDRTLRSANRVELRKTLDQLSTKGVLDYTFCLECDGKQVWSGAFTDYMKLSKMKLAFLKRKCASGSKVGIVDSITLG